MPKTAELRIKDYKSKTSISDLRADVEINTYKGEVEITNLTGSVDLETYKGEVDVRFSKLAKGSGLKPTRETFRSCSRNKPVSILNLISAEKQISIRTLMFRSVTGTRRSARPTTMAL
ncbi:MAG: hypothetical protein AAB269_00780, partial [Bacteroidota bacterium]